MNYEFPKIKTINDVLPAIAGRPEFIVADRGNHTIINYAVNFPDSFPPVVTLNDALRRECRGIVFDAKGNLLSRRFHKFFNISERDETQAHLVDLSKDHVVLDKLDGSMITPLYLDGVMRWGTKMGITDVAANAEAFANAHPQYVNFAHICHGNGYTPIFEWTSRKNRIVIDYPVDNLILTAIRDNYTGEYASAEQLEKLGKDYFIPVVKQYNKIEEITRFIESVQNETGNEGYVLRFHDGHMLKFKTSEYCLLHKSKEVASSEHNIIQAIVNEKIDDLKSLLIKEDLERVNEIETNFWLAVERKIAQYNKMYEYAYELSSGDRKNFALEHASKFNKDETGIIFSRWAGKDMRSIVLDIVNKNSAKLMRYEEFKVTFY